MGAVKRKMSQSQNKAGNVVAELNCKKDDFVKVIHRGIESSKVFEEFVKEYKKLSKEERNHSPTHPK